MIEHINVIWKPMNFNDSKKYIEELNSKKFMKCSNWRLPTIDELKEIYEHKEEFGIFTNELKSLSKTISFWSSETADESIAYYIDFKDFGKIKFSNIMGTPYLICVEGNSKKPQKNAKEEIIAALKTIGNRKVLCADIFSLRDYKHITLHKNYTPEDFETFLNALDFNYNPESCEITGNIWLSDKTWIERIYNTKFHWILREYPDASICD